MRIKEAIAYLNRYLAAYGDVELGVLGRADGKCGGLKDICMVELEVDGGAQIGCIISAEKLQCQGCELCRTGSHH